MIEPTEEQREICLAVKDGKTNLMVSAYAGTAKTTTLQLAAPAVKEPALALAFNKKISQELSGKLPGNFKVQTLNGCGFGAWTRTLDKTVSVKVDDKKVGKLVTAIAKDQRVHLIDWQWDSVRSAVKSAMMAGLSPDNVGSPLVPDSQEIWDDLIDCPSQDDLPLIRDLAREVLKTSIHLARQGQLSFDDQIYCPTILGGRWAQYPRVFVDEAQDLSPLNHVMLKLVTRPDGLVTSVGDPKQAIYGFRGADSNSMSNMRTLHGSWNDLSLTMTFRCPRTIVDRQQEHAPGYRAAPSNVDGQFIATGGWPDLNEMLRKAIEDLPQNEVSKLTGPPIAVLCRNNAPLLSLAFKLIRRGMGCQMLGRDIGKGIIQLATKLAPADEMPIVQFSRLLTDWQEREIALAYANDKPEKVDKIEDKAECLRATIEGTQPSTAGDLRSMLQRLFSRENSQIVLSSGHRAKGLEWPVVVHLDPWRIPSKQAKMAAMSGNPVPMEQEMNLQYVTETRTKHTLVNASLEAFGNG